jgi:hypothetical protein
MIGAAPPASASRPPVAAGAASPAEGLPAAPGRAGPWLRASTMATPTRSSEIPTMRPREGARRRRDEARFRFGIDQGQGWEGND